MSQICPQCGNDLYATSAEHRCSDFVMPYMCKTTGIDPRDAQIAALTEKLRAVEAERDEWKRKYETQCAGSMSAHERRIHLEAELRAELERKDAALKEAHEYMQKADDDLTSVLESRSPYGEERRRYEMSRNGMDYFEMARDVLDAALQPKEPPCKA